GLASARPVAVVPRPLPSFPPRRSSDLYLRDVRRLASHGAARGAAGPDALTATQLREFVYALKDLGLSPATIHRQISAVRTYFKFLVEEGLAARDPSERLESPKRWRTLPNVLTGARVE